MNAPRHILRVCVVAILLLLATDGISYGQVLSLSPHGSLSVDIPCSACHTSTAWSPAREDMQFNHASDARFELLGAHETVKCASCHVELRFDVPKASTDECESCHLNVHTVDLIQTCATCHDETSFRDVRTELIHIDVGFDLIGSHQVASCASCHQLPGLELLFAALAGNEDCVTCHAPDYEAAHEGSGFPTTCIDCHGQDSWEDATFDHDSQYFPIYSGDHRDEWNQCADCHTSAPITFEIFSCIDCHEHDRPSTDDEHEDVGDYVYESLACFSCHPDGSE